MGGSRADTYQAWFALVARGDVLSYHAVVAVVSELVWLDAPVDVPAGTLTRLAVQTGSALRGRLAGKGPIDGRTLGEPTSAEMLTGALSYGNTRCGDTSGVVGAGAVVGAQVGQAARAAHRHGSHALVLAHDDLPVIAFDGLAVVVLRRGRVTPASHGHGAHEGEPEASHQSASKT